MNYTVELKTVEEAWFKTDCNLDQSNTEVENAAEVVARTNLLQHWYLKLIKI